MSATPSHARCAAELWAAYPMLSELSTALGEAIVAQAAIHEFRDGTTLFREHQDCAGLPLVLHGAIKVFKRSESGREIVLYRVGVGESCILTSSCLLGGSDYSAEGVSEGALRLAMLPPALFHRLIAESAAFREFLFALLSHRLGDLMERVERLAFHRLDRRIAEFLYERTDVGQDSIAMTHQQIADEIGSVREMVTRTLGHFAEQGLVALSRSGVRVTDRPGLRALSDKGH